jgi:hypothetical protein
MPCAWWKHDAAGGGIALARRRGLSGPGPLSYYSTPMGSLQLGLAVLGAVVLGALMAHGAWQARAHGSWQPRRWSRAGSRVQKAAVQPDPADMIEPSFGPPAAASPARPPVPAEEPAAAPRRAAGPPPLDPLIDAIATLRLEAPIAGEVAVAGLPPTRRVGSKPMAIEGLDVAGGPWQPLQAGRSYRELQAGVQLANRSGALNEIEYSEFVQKIQAFADTLGANAEFPDMLDVVGRARELDGFAGQHDAQLAMRLHTRGSAWSVGFVLQQAGRLGFVPGVLPGRLVLSGRDDGAPPMLSVLFDRQAALADEPSQAAVREVTLAFDVPQTPAAHEPFKAWCEAGQSLARALGAMVSDDQGHELQAGSFGVIGEELAGLYDKLAERDLAAGSASARRLFS